MCALANDYDRDVRISRLEDAAPGQLRLKAGDLLATLVTERDLAAMESVLRHKVSFEEV